MGCWGPGLYENDDAKEIRNLLKSLARLPKDGADLLGILKTCYPADDPDDDAYSVLHLVAADQFYKYGIACPPLFTLARQIIEQGVDDRLMAGLDMSEADRKKRRRALETLVITWSVPPTKIAGRTLLKAPEKHFARPGDIYVFPTQDGNSANTNDTIKYIQSAFDPDGWAAFVIARNEHRLGWFSASFILRLHVDGSDKPDLEVCRTAPISGQLMRSWGRDDPLPAVGWTSISAVLMKKLQAHKVGAVDVSWETVCGRFPQTEFNPVTVPAAIRDILWVTNKSLSGDPNEWDVGAPLDVRLSDLTVER